MIILISLLMGRLVIGVWKCYFSCNNFLWRLGRLLFVLLLLAAAFVFAARPLIDTTIDEAIIFSAVAIHTDACSEFLEKVTEMVKHVDARHWLSNLTLHLLHAEDLVLKSFYLRVGHNWSDWIQFGQIEAKRIADLPENVHKETGEYLNDASWIGYNHPLLFNIRH